MPWANIEARDLQVGDIIKIFNTDRVITAIGKYEGRLAKVIGPGWIIHYKPGPTRSMSVWDGYHYEVFRSKHDE